MISIKTSSTLKKELFMTELKTPFIWDGNTFQAFDIFGIQEYTSVDLSRNAGNGLEISTALPGSQLTFRACHRKNIKWESDITIKNDATLALDFVADDSTSTYTHDIVNANIMAFAPDGCLTLNYPGKSQINIMNVFMTMINFSIIADSVSICASKIGQSLLNPEKTGVINARKIIVDDFELSADKDSEFKIYSSELLSCSDKKSDIYIFTSHNNSTLIVSSPMIILDGAKIKVSDNSNFVLEYNSIDILNPVLFDLYDSGTLYICNTHGEGVTYESLNDKMKMSFNSSNNSKGARVIFKNSNAFVKTALFQLGIICIDGIPIDMFDKRISNKLDNGDLIITYLP